MIGRDRAAVLVLDTRTELVRPRLAAIAGHAHVLGELGGRERPHAGEDRLAQRDLPAHAGEDGDAQQAVAG